MASYTRLGSTILATELAADPIGKIYRGLSLTRSSFEKHVLVRTFNEELLASGLGHKLAEAANTLPYFEGTRGFATNYRIEGGRMPHLVCDYTPGRSLAQVIEKALSEQVPLGVDHALSVLQGIGQAILPMHNEGMSHGMLTPHSVWVSFEGAIQLLDAPCTRILQGLLPKAKLMAMSLERYRHDFSTPLQKDFYSMGALFYELLTLEKPPSADLLRPTLAKATLKAAQDESPLPPEILNLLKRLLGLDPPFANAEAFTAELERVLYDGNYSPTTFNMAFFMHTLFREEIHQDLQAMKADQTADFSPFLENGSGHGSALESLGGQTYGKYIFVGASVLTAFFGALIWANISNRREVSILRKQMDDAKRKYEHELQRTAALKQQEDDMLRNVKELEEQKKATQSAAALKKLDGEIAAAQQKKDALTKQRVEAELKQKEQAEKLALAQKKVAGVEDHSLPPVEVKHIDGPPTEITDKHEKTDVKPNRSATEEDTPVQMQNDVPVKFPIQALKQRWQLDQEHQVTIKIFVDATGKARRVQFTENVPGTMGFDEAAEEAALASTYIPAKKNGKPVIGWLTKTYVFPKRK